MSVLMGLDGVSMGKTLPCYTKKYNIIYKCGYFCAALTTRSKLLRTIDFVNFSG